MLMNLTLFPFGLGQIACTVGKLEQQNGLFHTAKIVVFISVHVIPGHKTVYVHYCKW